jgi:anti-sigma factor RsiW
MSATVHCQQPESLASAYVLGQLHPAEHMRFRRHLATCAACRQAVARDRRLTYAVRQTIGTATEYDRSHVDKLIPMARTRQTAYVWRQPIAAAALIALLLLGGLSVRAVGRPLGNEVTATATQTPAATHTLTPTPQELAMAAGRDPGTPSHTSQAAELPLTSPGGARATTFAPAQPPR